MQKINYSSMKLPVKFSTELDPDKDYSHFAILFKGMDEKAIQAEYLVFPNNNFDNPSSKEEISIPAGQMDFTHGGLHIKINQCTGGDLAFTVLSDEQ
jgi:hypothetical protein